MLVLAEKVAPVNDSLTPAARLILQDATILHQQSKIPMVQAIATIGHQSTNMAATAEAREAYRKTLPPLERFFA